MILAIVLKICVRNKSKLRLQTEMIIRVILNASTFSLLDDRYTTASEAANKA